MMLLFVMIVCALQTSAYLSHAVNSGSKLASESNSMIPLGINIFMCMVFLISGLLIARKVNLGSN